MPSIIVIRRLSSQTMIRYSNGYCCCRMAAANNEDDNAIKPNVSIKPFIKQEKNFRFYIVPILSLALFLQFS